MFRIFLCILLSGYTAYPAMSQSGTPARWSLIGIEKNGAADFMDMATIITRGSIKRTWISNVFKDILRHGQSEIYAQKVLYEYDCAERRARPLEYVLYGASGDQVRSWSNTDLAWQYDLPGSIGASMTAAACGEKQYTTMKPGFDPVEELAHIRSVLLAQ